MITTFEVLKLVNHLEARLDPGVIHAADVDQVSVAELLFEERRSFAKLVTCDAKREFTAELRLLGNSELCGERGSVFARRGGHFE